MTEQQRGGNDEKRSRRFYEREYADSEYARAKTPENDAFRSTLESLIRTYQLESERCLEVGAGRGALQDLVERYFATDLARTQGASFKKPFVQASATLLPFRDGSFDVVWTHAVLEHIPDPEQALQEMRRVLRPRGLLFLHAAWYCRPWATDGYPVRPYSDFGWAGKLVKASIPLRNNILFRSAFVFPKRSLRTIAYALNRRPTSLRFRRLEPNYEKFWMSDSDAVASIDPYEAILWFESRGDRCLSHWGLVRRFLARTGTFVVQKGRGSEVLTQREGD